MASASLEKTKALIAQYGLTPNKALGQNFLTDDAAIAAIVRIAAPAGRPVLEIGPGLGSLTEGLLAQGKPVAAVEIDRTMARVLRERFGESLLLYEADFLKADLGEIGKALGGDNVCVVGNLPYYITTPICMRLLTACPWAADMTLMVQREAAARFTAGPGDRVYGPMAVLCRAYYAIATAAQLSPASFYPQPEVDSTVVRLRRNDAPFDPALPGLLRGAFRMRRKTLANNLKGLFAPDALQTALAACGIQAGERAEAVTPAQFIQLSAQLAGQP